MTTVQELALSLFECPKSDLLPTANCLMDALIESGVDLAVYPDFVDRLVVGYWIYVLLYRRTQEIAGLCLDANALWFKDHIKQTIMPLIGCNAGNSCPIVMGKV